MKFKFTKKVDAPVQAYGHTVTTDDVIELGGHLAQKAKNNPDFVIPRDRNPDGDSTADNK